MMCQEVCLPRQEKKPRLRTVDEGPLLLQVKKGKEGDGGTVAMTLGRREDGRREIGSCPAQEKIAHFFAAFTPQTEGRRKKRGAEREQRGSGLQGSLEKESLGKTVSLTALSQKGGRDT